MNHAFSPNLKCSSILSPRDDKASTQTIAPLLAGANYLFPDARPSIIERTARGHQAFDAINVVMRQLEQHLEQVLGAESYAALWAALCELSRDEIDPYTDLGSESATDDGQRPDNT